MNNVIFFNQNKRKVVSVSTHSLSWTDFIAKNLINRLTISKDIELSLLNGWTEHVNYIQSPITNGPTMIVVPGLDIQSSQEAQLWERMLSVTPQELKPNIIVIKNTQELSAHPGGTIEDYKRHANVIVEEIVTKEISGKITITGHCHGAMLAQHIASELHHKAKSAEKVYYVNPPKSYTQAIEESVKRRCFLAKGVF